MPTYMSRSERVTPLRVSCCGVGLFLYLGNYASSRPDTHLTLCLGLLFLLFGSLCEEISTARPENKRRWDERYTREGR
ncbi:hypothetical protein QBC35DRAFT_92657 [Podospora australis]|uniref:Uncharacterized protein n=1 Tax=Podospora australis TaxID=1536484 RepID=A0AAN7AEH1_9PEZI|nr:hypothetical protein QBC35DRAFT_92657 [Podospora australis]